MEPVSASARGCIVERYLQVVLAQEPLENTIGFFAPVFFVRQPVCLKASGDRGAGFDWLLIEAGSLRTLGECSTGANGHKNVAVTAVLDGYKPFERLDSRRDHSLVIAAPASQDKRLRQPRIGIRKALLKPMPGRGVTAFVDVQKAIGERVTNPLHRPVAGEPVQIGLQPEHTECPGARTAESQSCRNGGLKKPSCCSPQPGILRAAEHIAQTPNRPAMAVFRSNFLQPFAVIA